MRRTLMLLSTMVLTILLAGGLALVALSPAARADGDCQPSGSEMVCTFNFIGEAPQRWEVPQGVTQATFEVSGAQGGSDARHTAQGGVGGMARATIDVTPDDTLQVTVGGAGADGIIGAPNAIVAGGAGGFNGGAAGGSADGRTGESGESGGGGGGASDIRFDTDDSGAFALAERIIVAGGGGGAGGSANGGVIGGGGGGAGGGSEGGGGGDGSPFGSFPNGQGGSGGSASSGGVGGDPGVVWVFASCTKGLDGTLGVGGVGGECRGFAGAGGGSGGGGGGGGYYGGGGGGGGGFRGGGGGGGSGYFDPQASDVEFKSSEHLGDGLVTITYTPPDSTAPTVSSINRASSNPTNTTGNVDWTVTFSENVTGVDTGDFALVNSGLGGSPTISSVTQGANASVYTVTASSGTGSGTLGLNLNDDDSIADGAGNKLAGNGSFTGEVYTIDRAAPTVTSAAVKGAAPDFTGATNYVADTWTNKDVRVTFTCADTGGSGLNSASGNDVQTFTTETSGTTATFSGTCADNAGNSAAGATFGPIKIDKTAPSVTSTFPGNGREVGPAANIRATFSDEMLPASVMNAFKLFKKGSTTRIAATVTYDAATDTATLNPANNLRRGATYKAVVSTVATDKADNRLDQNSSKSGLQQKVWFFEIDE